MTAEARATTAAPARRARLSLAAAEAALGAIGRAVPEEKSGAPRHLRRLMRMPIQVIVKETVPSSSVPLLQRRHTSRLFLQACRHITTALLLKPVANVCRKRAGQQGRHWPLEDSKGIGHPVKAAQQLSSRCTAEAALALAAASTFP